MDHKIPHICVITPVDKPIRPVVLEFAARMEAELKANEHKGGWESEDDVWLVKELKDHLAALMRKLDNGGEFFQHSLMADREYEAQVLAHHIQGEAADVANFAMMLADNGRRRAGEILKHAKRPILEGKK